MLDQKEIKRFGSTQPPILSVVIDTEEEFDWKKDFSREKTSIGALRHINRVQSIFDEYNIVPVYVSDFPIVSQTDGIKILKEIQDSGRCLVGAHLHPWVNPPHEERVTPFNSFPGNLPYELEQAKLELLTKEIIQNFGRHPEIYKAGRYGIGVNTAKILEKLEYKVDLSTCPPYDYTGERGPDFSSFSPEPYYFGSEVKMLELPMTGAFIGALRNHSTRVYKFIRSPSFASLRLPGIFARLNLLDRLRLSPEGFTTQEHVKFTQALLDLGIRTFTWSFHSPTVEIGCTPYVKSQKELDSFLDKFRKYFDYFFGKLNGVTMTPLQLMEHIEKLDGS